MKALPHQYKVKVDGLPENNLTAVAENLPALKVAPPSEFDGPGDQWSPEELLVAAVASCLVSSFRAIAKASRLEWRSIECESQGELDRVDRQTQFTGITTKARLVIPSDAHVDQAEKILIKAEKTCFITNSLSVESHLECEIIVDKG